MAVHQALRARPRRPQPGGPFVQLQTWGIAAAILLLFLAAGAWALPRWRNACRRHLLEDRLEPALDGFSEAFNAHWDRPAHLPAFAQGDEPGLRAALQRDPLLTALVPRRGDRRPWVRQGDRLRRAPAGPEADFYLRLAAKLEHQALPFTFPEAGEDPDYGRRLTGACREAGFIHIRRLEPGSPALDAELARIFGPTPAFRVGLQHSSGRSPLPPEGRYQLPYPSAQSHTFRRGFWTRTQTPGWHWILVPSPALEAELLGRLRLLTLLPMAIAALPLGVLLLRGLLRRARTRRQEDAHARLADLIRGIQRPLSVLRTRCARLRGGDLARNDADCQLIRIGEEVEHLSLVIENGLRAAVGRGGTRRRSTVTRTWLATLAEDFEAPLAEAGRDLHLHLEGEGAQADLPALRQVLQAFLDNALLHGGGAVNLRSRRSRGMLLLEVGDEGPGLEAHALDELGQPFARFHPGAPGLGLGLSLAIQVATREGWGLRLASAPGRGFHARLDIPHGRPSWRPDLISRWRQPSRRVREQLSAS